MNETNTFQFILAMVITDDVRWPAYLFMQLRSFNKTLFTSNYNNYPELKQGSLCSETRILCYLLHCNCSYCLLVGID